MMPKFFIALLAFVALAGAAERKPNIVVIMADDLGYHDLGFQGSKIVKTPHLDALAKEGVVFTDAHVSASVCSPSRAGFMTGRYQQRFGHEANVPRGKDGMLTSESTMGQAFQSLGYRAFMVGKWHLGNLDEMSPTQRGFDEFWGLREGSRKYFYDSKDKWGNHHSIEHQGEHVKFDGFLTDRMTDAAITMIDSAKSEGASFFLFLSYTAPHGPLQATPEDKAKANGNAYHALIQNMDDNIGRMMAHLEKSALRENTVIWFLSDNGGTTGAASNFPLNGKKGIEFEGGHRVPFFVNWPGQIEGGRTFGGLTSAMDIFPTSFGIAGGKTTANPLDGVDLMPFLSGEKEGHPHDVLYWRKLEQAAIRVGNWKLIRAEGLPPMLYEIGLDLSELDEVSSKHPEKVAELSKRLATWEEDLATPLWQEGKQWIGVRKKNNIQFRDAEKIGRTLGEK